MIKYLRYTVESFKIGGLKLFLICLRYFMFKKTPTKDLSIYNPKMGKFHCRKNTSDFMFCFINYEYKIKNLIQPIIHEYDVFIDVGACIGDYCLWLAKNNLQCLAFEPNKNNYNSLVKNIQLNQLSSRIETFNFGLGEEKENVIFETHPQNKGYSGKYVNFSDSKKQKVTIKKFDNLIENLNLNYSQSVIMKIDAEGMEPDVIKGATEFLSKIKKILLIFETHTRANETLDELKKIKPIEVIEIDHLNMGVIIENKKRKV